MNSNLKYLFHAAYKDGSRYDQNIDDISVKDLTKSCYVDVDKDNLKTFSLSDGVQSYTLNLLTGGFSVNGAREFFLTTESLHSIKLVYYRKVTLDIVNDNRTMVIKYVLGFEAENSDHQSVACNIVIQ